MSDAEENKDDKKGLRWWWIPVGLLIYALSIVPVVWLMIFCEPLLPSVVKQRVEDVLQFVYWPVIWLIKHCTGLEELFIKLILFSSKP